VPGPPFLLSKGNNVLLPLIFLPSLQGLGGVFRSRVFFFSVLPFLKVVSGRRSSRFFPKPLSPRLFISLRRLGKGCMGLFYSFSPTTEGAVRILSFSQAQRMGASLAFLSRCRVNKLAPASWRSTAGTPPLSFFIGPYVFLVLSELLERLSLLC